MEELDGRPLTQRLTDAADGLEELDPAPEEPAVHDGAALPSEADADAVVRFATLSDAPELARLRWEFCPDDHELQTFDGFAADFEAWFHVALDSGRWAVFVAECDGRLVANLWLQRVDTVPRPGRIETSYGYVTNVYIEPEQRTSGIGGKVLERAIAHARARRWEMLMVWPSPDSVEFYAEHGFMPSVLAHADANDEAPMELYLPSS